MAKKYTKKKVLIIEDERNIAEAEGMILGDDYDVSYAFDGTEGLAKARKFKPDLIVLDLMLPYRGGYDVCFTIRQDPQLAHIKILMVTAMGQQVDRTKGAMVGTDAYLTKPFEPQQLVAQVKKLLS
ncbi:response regulator [Candidatus Woesearchaeota archaeon]|nr:response regulator [Candidatus Woesearchaeota archaeon]